MMFGSWLFSASSICCCVIEAGLAEGIWTINKAQGGLGASTYCAAVVRKGTCNFSSVNKARRSFTLCSRCMFLY